MQRELARKSIHLATIAVPVLVWLLPRGVALAGLGAAVLLALGVELARARNRWFRYHFLRRTRTMLRPHERRGIAGATSMVIAYWLALLLFPKPIAVTGMLYNGLGDATAALVGKRWGRRRVAWGKSVEGAAGMLVVTLLIGTLMPGIGMPAALFGALAATALEFFALPLDDNLRVTLGGGAALWAGVVL